MAIIEYDEPFRLRVLMRLSECLESVTVANGYKHDLTGNAHRGRILFGENDVLPLVSILEMPVPEDQLFPDGPAAVSTGEWKLLIQGFVDDDRKAPTDPAHRLMADVRKRLQLESKRVSPNSPDTPDPLGMGPATAQRDKDKSLGNVVNAIHVGGGVVRPPEGGISDKAYFWLAVTLKITEDISRPFV